MQPLDKPTESFLKLIEDFTKTFNKLDGKSSLETIEREEIGEVLRGLLRPFPTAVQRAAFDVFDTLRDF